MLLNNKNLFITGFSGTGKTTVARQVADALGWLYVDTDDLIVEMSKMNIEDIFKDQGEDGFRKYEYNVLSQVIQRENQVVSTGGGIVINSKNSVDLQIFMPLFFKEVISLVIAAAPKQSLLDLFLFILHGKSSQ